MIPLLENHWGVLGPMTLVPGMTKNGKAFLTLHVNGQPVGQWSPDDARGHARGDHQQIEQLEHVVRCPRREHLHL